MSKKILLVGESWMSFTTHVKGFDTFYTSVYETGKEWIEKAIIEAGQIKRIPINIAYLNIEDLPNRKKHHCLKVIIKLRNGRRHTSKQKYSYDELLGLVFGQALFSED